MFLPHFITNSSGFSDPLSRSRSFTHKHTHALYLTSCQKHLGITRHAVSSPSLMLICMLFKPIRKRMRYNVKGWGSWGMRQKYQMQRKSIPSLSNRCLMKTKGLVELHSASLWPILLLNTSWHPRVSRDHKAVAYIQLKLTLIVRVSMSSNIDVFNHLFLVSLRPVGLYVAK